VQFRADQRYAATRDAVLAAYTDVALYPLLDGLPKIGEPKVIDRQQKGHLVTLRVHYRFVADLPSAALAVIDPQRLTWIDETVYDLAAGTSTTRLLPDHYPDRLTASATATYTADPADPSRSIRHVRGDLKVRMALVGGKVERAIVEGLTEHLDDETGVVERFVDRA
jgi:hypothetical protein